MARLIDADALKDGFCHACSTNKRYQRSNEECRRHRDSYGNRCFKMRLIDEAPTVDAVPVVHGRWEPREDVLGFARCSVCHDCNIYDDWADGKKWNYCPNCGARMDLEEKHD